MIRIHTAGSKTHSLDFATTSNVIISAEGEALGGSSATYLCQFESSSLFVWKVCDCSQICFAKGIGGADVCVDRCSMNLWLLEVTVTFNIKKTILPEKLLIFFRTGTRKIRRSSSFKWFLASVNHKFLSYVSRTILNPSLDCGPASPYSRSLLLAWLPTAWAPSLTISRSGSGASSSDLEKLKKLWHELSRTAECILLLRHYGIDQSTLSGELLNGKVNSMNVHLP